MPNRVPHDRARVKVSCGVIGFRTSFKDSTVIGMLKAPVMLSLAANLLKMQTKFESGLGRKTARPSALKED